MNVAPAEVHNLKPGVPQVRVSSQLMRRREMVVVLHLAVRLGDGAESLPVEIHPRDDPAVGAKQRLQSRRRQSAIAERDPGD